MDATRKTEYEKEAIAPLLAQALLYGGITAAGVAAPYLIDQFTRKKEPAPATPPTSGVGTPGFGTKPYAHQSDPGLLQPSRGLLARRPTQGYSMPNFYGTSAGPRFMPGSYAAPGGYPGFLGQYGGLPGTPFGASFASNLPNTPGSFGGQGGPMPPPMKTAMEKEAIGALLGRLAASTAGRYGAQALGWVGKNVPAFLGKNLGPTAGRVGAQTAGRLTTAGRGITAAGQQWTSHAKALADAQALTAKNLVAKGLAQPQANQLAQQYLGHLGKSTLGAGEMRQGVMAANQNLLSGLRAAGLGQQGVAPTAAFNALSQANPVPVGMGTQLKQQAIGMLPIVGLMAGTSAIGGAMGGGQPPPPDQGMTVQASFDELVKKALSLTIPASAVARTGRLKLAFAPGLTTWHLTNPLSREATRRVIEAPASAAILGLGGAGLGAIAGGKNKARQWAGAGVGAGLGAGVGSLGGQVAGVGMGALGKLPPHQVALLRALGGTAGAVSGLFAGGAKGYAMGSSKAAMSPLDRDLMWGSYPVDQMPPHPGQLPPASEPIPAGGPRATPPEAPPSGRPSPPLKPDHVKAPSGRPSPPLKPDHVKAPPGGPRWLPRTMAGRVGAGAAAAGLVGLGAVGLSQLGRKKAASDPFASGR